MSGDLDAARTILADMESGVLPRWISVHLHSGFVEVSLVNWNQEPLSSQITGALDHLRGMAPHSPTTRREGSGGRKKSIRGFIDSWKYLGYLVPVTRSAGFPHEPFLTVRYDERHVYHEWRGYGPYGESDPTKAAIDWRCYVCSRRPTAKQREAAGIPLSTPTGA